MGKSDENQALTRQIVVVVVVVVFVVVVVVVVSITPAEFRWRN